MEGDLFELLQGVSPWWWVALGVSIGVLEMLTFTYYLIWLALAALATGMMLWAAPAMGGGAQLILFAALSVGFTFAGRFALARTRGRAETPGLNRRSDRMIGRAGKAGGGFEHGEGAVEIDGVRWSARLSAGQATDGVSLIVTGAEGMVLICATR
ncbi:MAG: NfeD family protein [Paracoccaceae bacterium]